MNSNFLDYIDSKTGLICDASDYIWEHPETAFTEYKSAGKICEVLEAEGFKVEKGLAGIETAFSGTFGSGKPVIGILGEFDALSGLGQVAGSTHKEMYGSGNGHGCGHNLLGCASLAAAIGVKKFLQDTGCEGTVIYFGTPGEEGGSGKAFMARDGVFDGVDAAFCWHPNAACEVRRCTSLANVQVLYKFDGQAAHAGAHPEFGRSALDAVELMNTGVQYLREHMTSDCRVHYAITDAGGFSPNVVQSHAEVLYLIRSSTNRQVKELHERVDAIAQGAALMTGTKVTIDFVKGCSNTILNSTMEKVLYEKMVEIGVPEVTEEDIAFAKQLTADGLMDQPSADPDHPIHYELKPYNPAVTDHSFGSTDVGDVSWVCPTAQIHTATEVIGTPGHSWQWTAQGKAPLAHKMMMYAGKVLAAAAVEMMEKPELVEKAKAEFKEYVGSGYECPIPKGVVPRSMDSFRK